MKEINILHLFSFCLSVCLSVCLSFCIAHAGIKTKRSNVNPLAIEAFLF